MLPLTWGGFAAGQSSTSVDNVIGHRACAMTMTCIPEASFINDSIMVMLLAMKKRAVSKIQGRHWRYLSTAR